MWAGGMRASTLPCGGRRLEARPPVSPGRDAARSATLHGLSFGSPPLPSPARLLHPLPAPHSRHPDAQATRGTLRVILAKGWFRGLVARIWGRFARWKSHGHVSGP
eukprot:357847-Chlamydomonas_euryale.AAC.3